MNITVPYLLSVCVAVKVDRDGVRWTDQLWAKDLALHTNYIENLTLACPHVFGAPSPSDVALNIEPFTKLKFVDLPCPRNHLEAIKLLPKTIKKTWDAVSANTIVHTGFGGWPINEGLLFAPIAKIQRKFLITCVESSFWRINESNHPRWRDKMRAVVLERLNRKCVQKADLRFFTSRAYLEEFLPLNSPHAYVSPATWIDRHTILDYETALLDWANKKGPVRLLFVGRLTQEKGLTFFLEATHKLSRSTDVSISVIGDGPLKSACIEENNVCLLEPISYGRNFFDLLRQFDAVVVPSVSHEQPRIIFDAFSQGIPVLGSDTGGIRELVQDRINGRLFPPASSDAIAAIFEWATLNRRTLQELGLAALTKSRSFSHQGMHEKRKEIILDEYESSL
jgi:glycosyltransferase involved in cell wall biosynthesis